MPGGDRTGPLGLGPMTGRGLGWCAGYPVAGRGFGRGFGRGYFGRGLARGWRHGFAYAAPVAPPTREQQVEWLKAQAAGLEAELQAVREQLDRLESAEEE